MKATIIVGVICFVLGITATASAIALDWKYHWTRAYPTSNKTITAIWNAIDAQGCREVDIELGLAAGTCSASMAPCSPGTVTSFACRSDLTTDVRTDFHIPGDWKPAVTP